METGRFAVVGSILVAGAAAGQPLDVIESQRPASGVASQVSDEVTGGQTFQEPRIVVDDLTADGDSVLERVRVYARPTSNVYALRLRVIELDAAGTVIAELADQTAGVARVMVDDASSADGFVAYEVVLDGPVGLRDGTRYGIEAVGLLTSPAMGDDTMRWRWAGAVGDGSMLLETDKGLVRLDHPGAAFEAMGEVLTPACVADVNEDGVLSPADFNAWILAFNSQDPRADQNGDGVVTPSDFNAWILNYNAGC